MTDVIKKTPYTSLPNHTHDDSPLRISQLVNADYLSTHEAMLNRTLERIAIKKGQVSPTVSSDVLNDVLTDELWVVEHNDVYTLGQAGKEEHILQKSNTPIIKTDRGGQVTWHGKGQLVIYWLFDLNKLNWKVRDLVSHAEQAIEDVVNQYLPDTLMAKARKDAPGVYIYQKNQSIETNEGVETGDMLGKIASLGFKIKQGYSYHGIALNLNCDLSAFNLINPCGYAGMQMLRLADFIENNHFDNSLEDSSLEDSSLDTDAENSNTSQNLTHQNLKVTQDLVSNISQRHMGKIPLRD